jgi:hypothetical protein
VYKFKKRHSGKLQIREPLKNNLDSFQNIFCNIKKLKLSPETTLKNGAYSEKPMSRKLKLKK